MVRLTSFSRRLIGSLALVLLMPSCLRVLWRRVRVEQPIDAQIHGDLRPLACDLTRCLERLGAPLYVWEESGNRIALAWGWQTELEWGVNLGIPLTQELGTTLDYADSGKDLEGLVLVFDASDQLIQKRVGPLAEIASGLQRRRPSLVEED